MTPPSPTTREDLVTIQMLENALARVEGRERERDNEFHRLMDERDARYLERHEAFKVLMLERDSRYTERDANDRTAVKLSADKAAEATAKLEMNLKEYREGANEWRDTVNDLIRRTPSGKEVDQMYAAINEKIADLRESRSKEGGKDYALEQAKSNQKWMVGLAITIGLSILAQVMGFFK